MNWETKTQTFIHAPGFEMRSDHNESIIITLSHEMASTTTGVVYDRRVLLHCGLLSHPERPERLLSIMRRLERKELLRKCLCLPSRAATSAELKVRTTAMSAEFTLQLRHVHIN